MDLLWIVRVLATVAGIGFLIFIHELGHFLLAKRHGVRVEIFSLGFGKAIWKVVRGGTEYRIAWVPLGGYVKMAGEPLGESRTGAPDELSSKTPWQRFQIFVAGTSMNFLFAFPICILSALIGKHFTVPVVGDMPSPESAEWEARMLPGDRIVSFNGMKIADLEAYRREVLRAPYREPATVTVERGGADLALTLIPRGSEGLGVRPRFNVVDAVTRDTPADKAGLRAGDVIEEIDGQAVWSDADIKRIVLSNAGTAMAVKVRRPPSGEPRVLSVTPTLRELKDSALNLHDALPEPVVTHVHPGARALDHLQAWDRFVKIGDRAVRSVRDVQEIVGASPEIPLAFEVLREGAVKAFTLAPRRGANGRGTLDVLLGQEGVCVLGAVPPGSPLAAAKAEAWDRVESVDGLAPASAAWVQRRVEASPGRSLKLALARGADRREVELPVERGEDGRGAAKAKFVQAFPLLIEVRDTWPLYAAGARAGDRILRLDGDGDGVLEICRSLADLHGAAQRGRPFPVVIEREGKAQTITVTPGTVRFAMMDVELKSPSEFRRHGPVEAVAVGCREVGEIVELTVRMLAKVVTREEKFSGFAGPVRIFQISYVVSGHGSGNFLWLLGVITVSLAVFNLLPIPILDGGHIAFLVVEAIKGRPVSEATLIRAQYVGAALLLSLLIMVTTNDIFGVLH